MSVVHDLCEYDGTLSVSEEAAEGKSVSSGGTPGLTASIHQSGGSMRKSVRQRTSFRDHVERIDYHARPSLQRSRASLDFYDDISEVGEQKDNVTQSLREISEELASKGGVRALLRHSEGSKKFLPHSANISRSQHGGDSRRRSEAQISRPSLSESAHYRDNERKRPSEAAMESNHSRAAESLSRRSATSSNHFRSESGHLQRRSEPGVKPLSQSLHRSSTPTSASKESLGQSLSRLSMARSLSVNKAPNTRQSIRQRRSFGINQLRDDSSATSFDASTVFTRKMMASVPYFEKLCWVCERLDYPYEYADIVGSQFLGLDGASPVTHVDGHVPTMDELVEFLALAFICIADYADLTVVFLDDFQWVDSFSWKIFRVLCKRGKKLLFMCATRSHDKQALRRLSTAASSQSQLQSQMVEISLGPLDFGEIRQLTAKILDHPESAVSENICADIFQRTGGLPVYVVQVAENMKRKKTVELDPYGVLQWTPEGLKEKVSLQQLVPVSYQIYA